MTAVTDVVDELHAGKLTLAQAAKQVAAMTFKAAGPELKTVYDVWDKAEDIDVFAPGTWNGDVWRLELIGVLTPQEYEAFSRAKDAASAAKKT